MSAAYAMETPWTAMEMGRRLEAIASLLEVRRNLSEELAIAPGFKQGTKWWNHRVREIRWANRTLCELGYCDCGRAC